MFSVGNEYEGTYFKDPYTMKDFVIFSQLQRPMLDNPHAQLFHINKNHQNGETMKVRLTYVSSNGETMYASEA